MNKTIDVIAMGRVAVDLYAEQINTPLSQVASFKKYLGGSPGNISVGCARLGLRSALISKVGQDAMGTFLLDTLRDEQVAIDGVGTSADHLTALAFLGISPPDTFPLLFYRHDCADMQLQPDDLNVGQISQAHYLQISGTGLSSEAMRQTTAYAMKIAKDSATQIVLDCDFRPILWGLCSADDAQNRFVADETVSRHYQTFLPDCDIIVGTADELCIAGGKADVFQAIDAIRQLSQAAIVFKKGFEGSDVHLPDGTIVHADTFPVDVFNTLGAGDAFLSGLFYGLIEQVGWQQALSCGNACGAIVSTRHGCAPAMPTKQALLQFMQQYPSRGANALLDLPGDHHPTGQSPLIKSYASFEQGMTPIVRRQDEYQTGMNFSILKLAAGEQSCLDAGLETAALLLTGQVQFSWENNQQTVSRHSYFDEAPYVLHTPKSQTIQLAALTDCEILIMQTDNDREFEAKLFDQASMLENEHRGQDLLDDVSYRMVRTVFDKRNRPESNLVVGEIITFQGRWSSCPPHYHPQPEIYHYRFSEPQGFAFAEDGEQAIKVHHQDTLVIQNQKTHAHVAAPGYALYTLWFIRHLNDAPYIVPEFVDTHEWCRHLSANLRAWRG